MACWLAVVSLASCTRYPAPPSTRVVDVVDTLHGVAVPDPYRWLENQDSPETRTWLAAQADYLREVVRDSALISGLEDRLRRLMDAPDVSAPRRAGD
ncbi:MAG TPA: hypothetical protein VD793_03110, partial [Gemmatimonadales bacterium]|nr:hypothetical protein [Gemmatimonadales bacterium]